MSTESKESEMMLTLHAQANEHDLFRLPFGGIEMSCKDIKEAYPEFSKLMDGKDYGACLTLYYDKNPLNGIYEFRDEDAEMDIAEQLGFDIIVCTTGESLKEKEERTSFLEVVKEKTTAPSQKTLSKKERRQLKVNTKTK